MSSSTSGDAGLVRGPGQAALRRVGKRPALVIGSTGIDAAGEAAIAEAAGRIAIVRSGNFSLGVNLLLGLVEQAARTLRAADWDIEVFEASSSA